MACAGNGRQHSRQRLAWTSMLPWALIAGSLAAHLFDSIPSRGALAVAAVAGFAALLWRPARWPGAMVLAACWSLWHFQTALDDRLPAELAGTVVQIRGVIASIPQTYEKLTSFRFEPVEEPPGLDLPDTLLVRWYEEWPELSVGERWRLELLLKPPWGPVNFHGSDRERWLFASRLGGVASVRGGEMEARADPGARRLTMLRQTIFRLIQSGAENPRSAGVIQALAVADRSAIADRDRRVLTLTGTTHLLAISGLHIGLAAAGGMFIARGLCWFLPFRAMGRGLRLLATGSGLLAAAAYAGLAGFGVATVRALIMLTVIMTAITVARTLHPLRAWTLALAAALIVDPLAALGAGFWFSFAAVAALMLAFVPRTGRRLWWRTPLRAQGAVMLVLLPLSAAWFQGASLVGLIANLVAIPLVSVLVVPLVLAGVAVLAVSAEFAGLMWTVAGHATAVLLTFLELLASVQGELTPLRSPAPSMTLLAMLGAVVLLLPRGLPVRWYGLFLLAPLFLPAIPRGAPDNVELDILDVGQGTAVVVRTESRMLLYDSGPGDGNGRDLVASVVAPTIRAAGSRAPDRVVISHGDLDHAGGLGSLMARYPRAAFNANLSRTWSGTAPCHTPLGWRWGETWFRVWHPTAELPYRGNDSSCVLGIERGHQSVLLSGDITAAVEDRLLLAGLTPYGVLVIPHHGSRTSSSTSFIDAVRPRVAVATAGPGNRFGFPRAEVRQRYESAGAVFWSTSECGALRIVMRPDGSMTASSARRAHPAPWRWPAAQDCPLRVELHATAGLRD